MKVNKLSYQITENDHKFDHSPRIEFLIDGDTISEILKTKDKSIPYTYFKNDLPFYFESYINKEISFLAVCNCGVASCGSVECLVEKKEDLVTFREISAGSRKFSKDFEFTFTRENYDRVIREILKITKQDKEANDREGF